MNSLQYLHGKPLSGGDLRTQMSDFNVFELLPFTPSGEGEHVLIHVRKKGINTIALARLLVKHLQVRENMVSYAGLKDRFAVCEQTFGVHLPGKTTVDLSSLNIDGVTVLSINRHHKKLRIGSLIGNRFELTLRNITDSDALLVRWQNIIELGVPNYFGEQRFGIDANNLTHAEALFNGKKIKDKKKRGLYLSAARSFLFNEFISARIEQNTFNELYLGDVCMLAGSQSVFAVDDLDDTLKKRLIEQDIDITAPMWGQGNLMTQEAVQVFEKQIAEQHPLFCEGLVKFGLKQERRKIRLCVSLPKLDITNNIAKISFCLPAGCYATTVLRELINYRDLTERSQTVVK